MDKETKELDAISNEFHVLDIKGQKFNLKYNMKAWKQIKKDFGGYQGIQKDVTEDPLAFMTDKMASLILIGVTDKTVTFETIDEALDNCTMRDLKDTILPTVMSAMIGALPAPAENPQQAEAEK